MDLAAAHESDEPGLHGVVPFRFACHRCARCCTAGRGYVWLEPDEPPRLAEALGMSPASFVERFVRRALDARSATWRLSLREDGADGGRCALLVGSNECSVYAARPEHCRAFPYWSAVLSERAAFESAREVCPGIAVEVEASTRARAFVRLEALYAEVDEFVRAHGFDPTARECVCSAAHLDAQLFATALEADFHHQRSSAGSTAGRPEGVELAACTLACRMSALSMAEAHEAFLDRLRSIESEMHYPHAYGNLRLMLAARAPATRERAPATRERADGASP